MRINKMVIVSSIAIAILGILMTVYLGCSPIIVDIGIGLLTGAIVSLVTSVLYYAYEWRDIISSVKKVIPSLYLEVGLIERLTGSILPQIPKVNLLADLNFSRLSGLASEAYRLANSSKVDDFSGLVKASRTEANLQCFRTYVSDLANLRSCIYDIELLSLSADCLQLELNLKQTNGYLITPAEWEALNEKRNLVNVRTAKVHEYEASLLLRIDELGGKFFYRKNETWGQIKKPTEHLVDEAAAHVNYLDSL